MKKTIIISSIVLGSVFIGGFVIWPQIKKSAIRRRLDEIFNNPNAVQNAGGLDKFLVSQNEVFDPDTFNRPGGKATITRMEARERAQIIWENYSSWFSSNQAAIVNAFSGLKHVHDVSKISHEFTELYGDDLLTVLKKALTDKGKFNILIDKINKLPK